MEQSPGANHGKSVLDISVRNPVTHNTWDKGRYTSYEIAVNTSNKSFCLSSSTTRRRFSEFEWLRKTLKNHHPLVTPPELPPKKYFGDRFDPIFVAVRMKGLEDYLNDLLKEKVYLSDTTMHLFLQTNLSVKEIKEYIEGKISAYSLESLWKANGVKENCKEFSEVSTKDQGEWTLIKKAQEQKSDNVNVSNLSTNAEDPNESNNSDISSSYSDDDGRSASYPSISVLPKSIKNISISGEDSDISSEVDISSLRKTSKGDNSLQSEENDDQHFYKEIDIDARSLTDVELEKDPNYVVTNKFSINSIEG